MQTFWLAVLGVLLAGYFVLEGADFGAGMLLATFGRSDRAGRDGVVRALAPFFLGNEVWLVAAAGTLLAAFPALDGALLSRLYPLLVPILVAWLARDAGLWFRRHLGGPAWRLRWERVIAAASAVLAFGWGMVLGNLAQGVPPVGSARVFGPVPLLCGLLVTGWCLVHGAAFLGRRMSDVDANRLGGLVARLALPVAGVVVVTTVVAALAGGPAASWPGLVLALLLFVGVLAAGVDRGRRIALLASSVGLAAVLPLLIAAGGPVLPTGLSVTDAMADPATLGVLTAMVVPVLPILAGAQAVLWWLLRAKATARVGSYF